MTIARVLRTAVSFYPYVTGPANQVYHVSRGLGQRGIASPIYTSDFRAKDAPRHEVKDGVEVTRLPELGGFMAYRLVKETHRLFDETADLIHAHGYRSYMTTLSRRYATKKKVPYVLQPHGTLLMYRFILQGIRRLPYRGYDAVFRRKEALSADAVIVATRQEEQEAIEFGIAPDRLHVIPVGIDVDPHARRERRSDPLTLLFVGRITPGRNIETLLRGLARLIDQRGRCVRLRIVGGAEMTSLLLKGGPYLERMKQLARDRSLDDLVEWTGPLYGDDLTAAYRSADVFVYMSHYESFGQTMLEAAAHGLPVVATPTGVAHDLVEDDVTGFLVDPDDPDAPAILAERLSLFLDDPGRVDRLREAIVTRVEDGYRWERIIDRYVDVYESVRTQ